MDQTQPIVLSVPPLLLLLAHVRVHAQRVRESVLRAHVPLFRGCVHVNDYVRPQSHVTKARICTT